ncbi:MAG: prepilin peptidase [Planctomycetales bacterium]
MVLWDIPLWIMLPYLFIMGAVVGSFLNVCIYRMPLHETVGASWKSLLHPPSRCGHCFHPIPLKDNIPILGWFLLGGRCRFCRRSYSIRYAGIEFLNGLLFAFLYWCEVPAGFHATLSESCVYHELGPQGIVGSAWLSPAMMVNWRYLYHLVLVEMLVVATFIDFDLQIIPDCITYPAIAVGVVGGAVLGQMYLVPVWFERRDLSWQVNLLLQSFGLTSSAPWNPEKTGGWAFQGVWVPEWVHAHPHLHGLVVSLAGFAVGYGIVWGVRWLGTRVLKREAMGMGDAYLMAAVGAFLGWQGTLMAFFLAPVLALGVVCVQLIFRKQREIPYGPYLSLATLLVIVGWKSLSPSAMRIFELGRLLPFFAVFMAIMLFVSLLLVQGSKRLFGWDWEEEEVVEEWTSADQLTYQASAKGEWQQGGWVVPGWPGPLTARGEMSRQQWRDGPQIQRSNGWQQSWQRRGPGR